MIVPDVSALVALLLAAPEGAAVKRHLLANRHGLHVPHLVDLEVAQVVRRFAGRGEISDHRGLLALESLADIQFQRHRHIDLLPRVWALRHNISAYDAVYVALAEVLGAELLTLDQRLASAARLHVRVAVL